MLSTHLASIPSHAIMFNLITYNVKGLQKKSKRLKVFNFLKQKLGNDGLVFMQETHSTTLDVDKWKSEWGGELFLSHGKSNACGTAIGFTKNFDFKIENISYDKNGRITIIEILKDDVRYLLINFYNANVDSEQLNALNSLNDHLSKFDLDREFKPIFMGDMNVIFDTELDALGGNPKLKKKSLASLIKLLSKIDVSDIFRIRFPDKKRFTFRQKIGNSVIHRRLDYIFLSISTRIRC